MYIQNDAERKYIMATINNYDSLSSPLDSGGGCELVAKGRGDCEHFVGLPGKSIPGQHDGPDDTLDVYGKPNGWCWSCWKSLQIRRITTALQWCSGSADFGPGGKAHGAWVSSVRPLIKGEYKISSLPEEEAPLDELSASEALYGFCAWLTSQKTKTVMSGVDNAAVIADRIAVFCKKNNLTEPRENWTDRFEHPEDLELRTEDPSVNFIGEVTSNDNEISKALKHLSGDLNHNNVVAAKSILKQLLDNKNVKW